MTQKDPFAELDKLADTIVTRALLDATSLEEKLDAFKVVSPYYMFKLKTKSKAPEDPDEENSFADFQSQIAEATNGHAKVRSRSRRPS